MNNIIKELNETQQEAVLNITGPSLVIAGAGSGKTRVLTYRIAFLLSQGIPAYNILALTFTNKAAAEMKERIALLVGQDVAKNLIMGTFHSVFSKILRIESNSLIGYDANYTIMDTDDVKKLLTKIIVSLNINKDQYKASKVASLISKAKNDLIPPDMYQQSNMWMVDKINHMEAMPTIYQEYVNQCRKSNSMDFDDLLLMTSILFRDNPSVLQKYQQIFKYILVDEYQDTNICQYHIIRKLALPDNNVCVVGDDAQSIYSFRGAKIENILNFSKDYPQYKLFKLEQNYRSTQTIVNAANSLIKKNRRQIPKTTFSEQEEGEQILLMETLTDAEEGVKIASLIDEKIHNGEKYSDFAILYRSNAQSRIIEESLNRKRIPCKVVKGMSFFQRKEIKDVLAYVKLVINPRDENALLRIVNYPARNIGEVTVNKISDFAKEKKTSMWNVIKNIDKTMLFSPAVTNKILDFASLIQEFITDEPDVDAYSLMNRIVEKIGIRDALSKEHTEEEAQDKYNNIMELLNGAKEFVENELDPDAISMHNYIEKIALLTDIDEEDTENPEKVLLMTVHASKGLEFRNCFIVGMEEDLFPSLMSGESEKGIEEERRLFYVALTRAKKTVTLSYALSRRKYGNLNNSMPSRFLSDIDSKYINGNVRKIGGSQSYSKNMFNSYGQTQRGFDSHIQYREQPKFSSQYGKQNISQSNQFVDYNNRIQKTSFTKYNESSVNQPFVPSDASEIRVGQRVKHAKFGYGNISSITGEDANLAAIIRFDGWGEKKLLLKFAKLQIVKD